MKHLQSQLFVVSLLILLALAPNYLRAQNVEFESGFQKFTFRASSDINLRYRLHVPADESIAGKMPLIVYLHGSGGWGLENEAQIKGGNVHGTGLWLHQDIASDHPAFVLAPQLPPQATWADPESASLTPHTNALMELISSLEINYRIDSKRIYLVGQSLGGAGVWDLIAKRPERFAAAVPICGFGNIELVANARAVPIWAFHGELDVAVPVERSRELVSALRSIGGNITYTEYAGVGHNAWIQTFAEPELPSWLFSKSLE